MFTAPVFGIVDLHRPNRLGESVVHRDRYPLPTLSRFDAVSILPLVLFVLNRVEKAKNVRFEEFIKITQPW